VGGRGRTGGTADYSPSNTRIRIQYPRGLCILRGITVCSSSREFPAIAVSSKWLIDNLEEQDITHIEGDNIDIIDPDRLVEIVRSLGIIIERVNQIS
jgi:hypothetical protein